MGRIQFLYSSDCPSYRPALSLLRDVLADEQLMLEIEMISIDTVDQAQRTQFPGSPTIRIDGRDIEGAAAPPVGLTCRTYQRADGTMLPTPPKDVLRRAVRMARAAPEPPV